MKRRGIVGMLLLGLLIMGVTACGSGGGETTSQQSAKGDINVTITADGNIEASSHERLTFGSGGKIDKISVKEGDNVNKGDILAKLDTGALELAEAQAQVTLTQAQVTLTQAQVALTQAKLTQKTAEHSLKNTMDTEDALELALFNAQIEVRSAEHHYDETRDIYTWPDIETAQKDVENAEAFLQYALERNLPDATITYAQERLNAAEAVLDAKRNAYDTEEVAIAKLQLEAAKLDEAQAQKSLAKLSEDLAIKALEVESAKESVDHAQRNVNLAQQNVNLVQKSLDQARKDMGKATIIAPFDGVVANVGAKEGEFLSPAAYTGTTIVEIIDLRHMELTARVDELDVARVKTGQKVLINIDAIPEVKLEGQVTFISPVAREPGAVLFEDEDEEKDYEVKIDFDISENSPIRAGMSATAEIIVE
jgi:HlyD family secretion protein